MTTHLRGRVGVVTFAGHGIGRDIATNLASEGMSLLLIDARGASVRELADDLSERFDVRCLPAVIDLTDQGAIDRIVMHAEQQLGAVDLLVHESGGPQLMSDTLLPTMRVRGRGHIVNIGSAGDTGTTSLEKSGVVVVELAAGENTPAVVADVVRGRYDDASGSVIDASVPTPPRP